MKNYFEIKVFKCLIGINIFMACFSPFLGRTCYSQISESVLKVETHKSFVLDKDSLFLNSLELEDNSELILAKPNHYINVKDLRIGKRCKIIGVGSNGKNGANGRTASSPTGICKNGLSGTDGYAGAKGENGKTLVLLAQVGTLSDTLTINLNGGNGGDGGKGGMGSTGSRNTPHCLTNGGNGGKGGDGGTEERVETYHFLLAQLIKPN